MLEREKLQDKKRIVIKIGSSSLTHAVSGDLNLQKIEKLVRIISDLKGQRKRGMPALPQRETDARMPL